VARRSHLESALVIRKKQFHSSGSDISRFNLTEAYAMIAQCCEMSDDSVGIKECIMHMKKLIASPDSIKEISAADYENVKRTLICNNYLGHLFACVDVWNEAFICIGNSVLLAQKLVQISDTLDSRRQLVLAHINDGDQHAFKKVENHVREAERAYEKAYAEIITLCDREKTTFELKTYRARIIRKLAYVKGELGLFNQSEKLYSEAISQIKELCESCGSVPLQKDIYDSLRENAMMQLKVGNIEKSEKLLIESIDIADDVMKKDFLAVYKRDKAGLLFLLGDVYKKQWDVDGALKCYLDCCSLWLEIINNTGRISDMKMYETALKSAVSAAKLAGDFEKVKILTVELTGISEKFSRYFN